MADRAFMYCPLCRNAGNPTAELMRDNVDYFCLMGHRMPHAQMGNLNPEMIKTEVRFKPGPGDVKAEIWVNGEVAIRAKEALGERFHPTVASLIRSCMAGEPILIDGKQAEELRKLGIKNGAEMLAAAKLNVELSGQNESYVKQINEWEERIRGALSPA